MSILHRKCRAMTHQSLNLVGTRQKAPSFPHPKCGSVAFPSSVLVNACLDGVASAEDQSTILYIVLCRLRRDEGGLNSVLSVPCSRILYRPLVLIMISSFRREALISPNS